MAIRGKLLPRVFVATLAIAFLLGDMAPPFQVPVAHAQEIKERRSIIDFFFGGRKKRKQDVTDTKPRKKKPRNRNSVQSVTTADAPGTVEKLPDARKVIVVGDFMASALADGLVTAFATDPNIVIEKKTDGSSGLARTDHLDWPATLSTYIEEIKPKVVVVMLGANDRQQIAIAGTKEKFQSDAWKNEYQKRIDKLLEVARSRQVPIIWTGLPSFQSNSLSTDAAALNNIYRSRVEMTGATFIDIWDGFADEDGKFIATGSDINGQPVRLRGSDGLSLTRAGKRKMAFYLEKSIRSLADVATMPAIALPGTTDTPAEAVKAAPDIADIKVVPPVNLADPELDGSTALLDDALIPKSSGNSPRDRLIEKGETVDAPVGRVDDFAIRPATPPKVEPAG
ncbi:SGNH/GDSL hydrolase family protein [Rhizobium alvei]|uniref:SGNH/GDSL hydrolase family protein n=1 Tax=Rhizobium alvei TaxID=1132659 RepID=UPI003392F1BF